MLSIFLKFDIFFIEGILIGITFLILGKVYPFHSLPTWFPSKTLGFIFLLLTFLWSIWFGITFHSR